MCSESESRTNFLNSLYCFKCNSRVYMENPSLSDVKKCVKCDNIEKIVFCIDCNSRNSMCCFCQCKVENNKALGKAVDGENKITFFSFCLVGLIVAVLWYTFSGSSNSVEEENVKIIKTLRKDFPSQRNETFYEFLNVLDTRIPTVKSIIFLHGRDLKTPMCLTKTLVFLYKNNRNFDLEEITFSLAGFETKDYGFALEHYRRIVKKYGVFLTHLNSVPGNIARIFHSLCDEVSSDIKPSLFIFTMKFDDTSEKLKPIEKATTALKKIWSNLPQSELFPILARVVKNVVTVIPENQLKC